MLSITIRSNPSSSSKLAMSATRNRTAPVGRLSLRHHLCRDVYADDLGVRVAIGQPEGGTRPGADVEDAAEAGLQAIERGHERLQVFGRVGSDALVPATATESKNLRTGPLKNRQLQVNRATAKLRAWPSARISGPGSRRGPGSAIKRPPGSRPARRPPRASGPWSRAAPRRSRPGLWPPPSPDPRPPRSRH